MTFSDVAPIPEVDAPVPGEGAPAVVDTQAAGYKRLILFENSLAGGDTPTPGDNGRVTPND